MFHSKVVCVCKQTQTPRVKYIEMQSIWLLCLIIWESALAFPSSSLRWMDVKIWKDGHHILRIDLKLLRE